MSNALIPSVTFKSHKLFFYYVCSFFFSVLKMFWGHAEWSVYPALAWRIHHSWTRKVDIVVISHCKVRIKLSSCTNFTISHFWWLCTIGIYAWVFVNQPLSFIALMQLSPCICVHKSFFQRNRVSPNPPLAFEEVKMHFRLFEEGRKSKDWRFNDTEIGHLEIILIKQ